MSTLRFNTWQNTGGTEVANSTLGTGKILQVVYGSTNTSVALNSNVWTDTTLTVTITPTSASSEVLVLVNQQGVYKNALNANNAVDLKLLRNSTDLISFSEAVLWTQSTLRQTQSVSCSYLDSPATTSATTYKTQFRNPNNTDGVYVQLFNTVAAGGPTPVSTIIAFEVSA